MSGFPKNTFGGTLCFLIVLVHVYVSILLARANVMMHVPRNRDFEHLHFQPGVVR